MVCVCVGGGGVKSLGGVGPHVSMLCLHFALVQQDILAPLHTGLTIHFAQPDAMKGSLLDTLKVGERCAYEVFSTILQFD